MRPSPAAALGCFLPQTFWLTLGADCAVTILSNILLRVYRAVREEVLVLAQKATVWDQALGPFPPHFNLDVLKDVTIPFGFIGMAYVVSGAAIRRTTPEAVPSSGSVSLALVALRFDALVLVVEAMQRKNCAAWAHVRVHLSAVLYELSTTTCSGYMALESCISFFFHSSVAARQQQSCNVQESA